MRHRNLRTVGLRNWVHHQCPYHRDVDARSNHSRDPLLKVLTPTNMRNFTPFMVSTDGLLGKEASPLLKKLSSLLAEKWEKLYSKVCDYVHACMSIAIVQATNLCICCSWMPMRSKMNHHWPPPPPSQRQRSASSVTKATISLPRPNYHLNPWLNIPPSQPCPHSKPQTGIAHI
jgi:hypothetical protein